MLYVNRHSRGLKKLSYNSCWPILCAVAPYRCHAPSYWMISKVSKAKVLAVEVSRSSLSQGMFFKSLSGLCVSDPLVVRDLDASLHLLWHWRQMLNVVADVRCVGMPRASVM